MSFQLELQLEIEKVIFKYIDKLVSIYNLDRNELVSLWNNKETKTNEIERKKSLSTLDTTLSVEKITKSTVAELKAFCKSNNLKCSGKKDELISRLLDKLNGKETKKSLELPKTVNKASVKEHKEKMISDVAKKIVDRNETENIALRKNNFGNYEHPPTHLVFNATTQSVIGVQNTDGTIGELTEKDIENCKQYKFKYTMPSNLDSNSKLEEIKIAELEEQSIVDKIVSAENEMEVEDEEEEIEEEDEIEVED